MNDSTTPGQPMVRVTAAREDAGALRDFIRFPWRIYDRDPHWVPPLLWERKRHYSKHNSLASHVDWTCWLAQRDEQIVGRISAQIDRLYHERYGDPVGFFGSLEAIDDQDVFAALLKTAQNWLQERGISKVRGPFNLNINQEVGLLVDGFETPPRFMMGHAPPYYARRLQACGYDKAVDVLAYRVTPNFAAPPVMTSLARRYQDRIRVYPADRSRREETLGVLRDIFNDAWYDNWGFTPFSDAEFQTLGSELLQLIPKDYAWLADYDNRPAAFIIMLADINQAIADLNGRLLPFGWLKLLWRLKLFPGPSARVPLMGVRREFHNSPLGAALAFRVIDAVRWAAYARGARDLEISWILENNAGMRAIAEAIGAELYKTYRIYERELLD